MESPSGGLLRPFQLVALEPKPDQRSSCTSLLSGQNSHILLKTGATQTMLRCLLEGELLATGAWTLLLGAVGIVVVVVFFANTNMLLTNPTKATLAYLEDIDLQEIGKGNKLFKAQTLWEKTGAVVMAEASELSSLKPQLEESGVPLYAVVKENVGTEVQNFRHYFAGEIFLDEKQRFYGPQPRKMSGLGLIRLGVLQNYFRAKKKGFQSNMKGEGFTLGGVFVIGRGKQGILLEHREKEFGDKVDIPSVIEAVKKIQLNYGTWDSNQGPDGQHCGWHGELQGS
ncbi:redox-regulatory protein FAM213A-like [Arapaima gigas]